LVFDLPSQSMHPRVKAGSFQLRHYEPTQGK
jgi:hypothetical protein